MSQCFLCKSATAKEVVSLGYIHPSGFADNLHYKSKREKLSLEQCPKCSFVQLGNILPPDSMYREYWYRSGLNNTMVTALKDVVDEAMKRNCSGYKRVMDIGCNDGTLLSFYPDNYFKVGYDPANNLEKYAIENCNIFINDYFNDKISFSAPFDIITSIAMFYDLEEPRSFIKTIKKYLAKSGLWVVQMTDLMCTIKANAYDNICHEHIAYYSLDVLKRLLEEADMEIFDLEYNDVNGASVRLYIQNKGFRRVSVNVTLAMEEEGSLLKTGYWDKFNSKIDDINHKVINKIDEINSNNEVVFGLGASTKGNTFLQVCGLGEADVPYILEVSKDKFGKIAVGSDIPIISEAEGFAKNPNYLLILPWHFTEFFLKRHLDFLKKGGKFLVAMPEPGVWGYNSSNEAVEFEKL